MNIVVLLAGIADTKWPLRGVELAAAGVVAGDEKLPRKLSPFDEAALETALQLRDAAADPSQLKISAVLAGTAQAEAIVRHIASFRLHRATWIDAPATHRWDAQALAGRLVQALAALDAKPDLVLAGREFGDCDDGALPPQLAEALGWRFVALAQQVLLEDGKLKLRRTRGSADEWLRLPAPLVASVTNDKSNRLRHPLMKNVMAAKRESFAALALPDPAAAPRVSPRAFRLQEAPRRQGAACRMIDGTAERKVAELAAYLRQWKVEA